MCKNLKSGRRKERRKGLANRVDLARQMECERGCILRGNETACTAQLTANYSLAHIMMVKREICSACEPCVGCGKLLTHQHFSVYHTRSYDKVIIYAREVLSMGMLHAEFRDTVKEGDGPCVIRVWKFLLPTFRAANRIQAFTLLAKCI